VYIVLHVFGSKIIIIQLIIDRRRNLYSTHIYNKHPNQDGT